MQNRTGTVEQAERAADEVFDGKKKGAVIVMSEAEDGTLHGTVTINFLPAPKTALHMMEWSQRSFMEACIGAAMTDLEDDDEIPG